MSVLRHWNPFRRRSCPKMLTCVATSSYRWLRLQRQKLWMFHHSPLQQLRPSYSSSRAVAAVYTWLVAAVTWPISSLCSIWLLFYYVPTAKWCLPCDDIGRQKQHIQKCWDILTIAATSCAIITFITVASISKVDICCHHFRHSNYYYHHWLQLKFKNVVSWIISAIHQFTIAIAVASRSSVIAGSSNKILQHQNQNIRGTIQMILFLIQLFLCPPC